VGVECGVLHGGGAVTWVSERARVGDGDGRDRTRRLPSAFPTLPRTARAPTSSAFETLRPTLASRTSARRHRPVIVGTHVSLQVPCVIEHSLRSRFHSSRSQRETNAAFLSNRARSLTIAFGSRSVFSVKLSPRIQGAYLDPLRLCSAFLFIRVSRSLHRDTCFATIFMCTRWRAVAGG